MKQQFIFGLTVLLLMVLIPLVSLVGAGAGTPAGKPAFPEPTTQAQASPATEPADIEQTPDKDGETIQVVRSASGKTETLAMREYLIGCVAAEMEADHHLEALKAQAVASYTYARYRREIAGKESLSDSGKSDQGYDDAQRRRQRWGGNFELYDDHLAARPAGDGPLRPNPYSIDDKDPWTKPVHAEPRPGAGF